MSLLDKQEVQDIWGHTALRARNGADLYVNERQKIGHYHTRSGRRRRKKKNAKSQFFTLRGAYVKLMCPCENMA